MMKLGRKILTISLLVSAVYTSCAPSDFSKVFNNDNISLTEMPIVAFRSDSSTSSGYSDVLFAQRITTALGSETLLFLMAIDGSDCGSIKTTSKLDQDPVITAMTFLPEAPA